MNSTKRNLYSLIFLIGLFSTSTFSQKKALNSINENDLQSHLEFIASDILEGRETGKPGIEIAAKYLTSNLKKMNLTAIGEKNSYLQYIDLLHVQTDFENTFITINSVDGNIIFTNDSILNLNPTVEDLQLEGPIVFAGYGFVDSVNVYNDFEGIDIKDKIIMIMSRTPELVKNPISEDQQPFQYIEFSKFQYAYKNGAKAILWVFDPNNKYRSIYDLKEYLKYFQENYFLKENSNASLPFKIILITQYTANQILKSMGHTLRNLQIKINSNNKPESFDLERIKISLQIKKKVKEIKSPNVIGIVEGNDPILKNEYIIYTAHYDHEGVNKNGEVFNGADDNGSGTVALLEIAEAFMNFPKKLKRSVVFAWMTAEEKGLFGSKYYASHPVFPLEKTIVCINLDMVGRVKTHADTGKVLSFEIDVKDKDSLFVISGHQSSELIKINEANCKKLQLLPDYDDDQSILYQSDQYPFYQKGIPVLFYHTGIHSDLHTIHDEIGKIDYTKMKRVAQLAFLVGYKVACQSHKLVVDKPINKE